MSSVPKPNVQSLRNILGVSSAVPSQFSIWSYVNHVKYTIGLLFASTIAYGAFLQYSEYQKNKSQAAQEEPTNQKVKGNKVKKDKNKSNNPATEHQQNNLPPEVNANNNEEKKDKLLQQQSDESDDEEEKDELSQSQSDDEDIVDDEVKNPAFSDDDELEVQQDSDDLCIYDTRIPDLKFFFESEYFKKQYGKLVRCTKNLTKEIIRIYDEADRDDVIEKMKNAISKKTTSLDKNLVSKKAITTYEGVKCVNAPALLTTLPEDMGLGILQDVADKLIKEAYKEGMSRDLKLHFELFALSSIIRDMPSVFLSSANYFLSETVESLVDKPFIKQMRDDPSSFEMVIKARILHGADDLYVCDLPIKLTAKVVGSAEEGLNIQFTSEVLELTQEVREYISNSYRDALANIKELNRNADEAAASPPSGLKKVEPSVPPKAEPKKEIAPVYNTNEIIKALKDGLLNQTKEIKNFILLKKYDLWNLMDIAENLGMPARLLQEACSTCLSATYPDITADNKNHQNSIDKMEFAEDIVLPALKKAYYMNNDHEHTMVVDTTLDIKSCTNKILTSTSCKISITLTKGILNKCFDAKVSFQVG